MIKQEQLYTSPRVELYEAEVGHDRSWVMLGNRRTGKMCSTTFCIRWSRKQIDNRRSAKVCWSRNLWKLSVGKSTSCARILKLKDTWEVVRGTRCFFCLEKRENHGRINSESEPEELLREPWQERPGWKRTESLGESESERGEELEVSEVQGMCLRNPGIKMMSRWWLDMRTHLAVTS